MTEPTWRIRFNWLRGPAETSRRPNGPDLPATIIRTAKERLGVLMSRP